jgi:hypothetical protein
VFCDFVGDKIVGLANCLPRENRKKANKSRVYSAASPVARLLPFDETDNFL